MPLFSTSPLLDWLYPPICSLCQVPLRKGRNICGPCSIKLPLLTPHRCLKCGQEFDGKIAPPQGCPNCLTMKPAFDFATAALKATDDSINLIHQLKLLKRPELGSDLAQLASKSFTQEPRLSRLADPILIPVPLHGKRLRSRRFNQAEVIAQSLAEQLNLELLSALKRIRPTERQATLSRKERLKNLRKAFQLCTSEQKIASRHLVLIDDVFTTGSTAQECARVLRTANPASIAVFTILRA
ncbi:MAG: ComF family protein [Roseibacillus sp.]